MSVTGFKGRLRSHHNCTAVCCTYQEGGEVQPTMFEFKITSGSDYIPDPSWCTTRNNRWSFVLSGFRSLIASTHPVSRRLKKCYMANIRSILTYCIPAYYSLLSARYLSFLYSLFVFFIFLQKSCTNVILLDVYSCMSGCAEVPISSNFLFQSL